MEKLKLNIQTMIKFNENSYIWDMKFIVAIKRRGSMKCLELFVTDLRKSGRFSHGLEGENEFDLV